MDVLTETLLLGAKWALPLLALWILARCLRSMLRERYEPEVWGWLEAMDGSRAALKHWECILGRAESCDVTIRSDAVLDTHAVLVRSDRGRWTLYDLSGGDTLAEGETDAGRGLELQDGDVLWFGDQRMIFHDLDEAQRAAVERERGVPGALVSQGLTLLLLSIFQLLLALEYTQVTEGRAQMETALGFAFLILLEWCCYLLMRAMDRRGFELETLAFFLCTLGLAVSASSVPEEMPKQILMLLAGVLLYLFLGFWFRDLRRTKALRWPVAAAALGFLALNVALGVRANGASNWLDVGMFRLQPSEFVKLAYIYVGATSLDRLYRRRNLFLFIGFSAVVVGALALMGDFGAALIFFVTFLVISFLRSGSFATVFLAVAGAVLAGVLVLTVKPYVAQRFAAWGHVWEDPYGAGWQQTQALSAAASGGLTGVGAGRGWLHKVFAADTDMVFCLVSEELGLLVALCAILAVIGIAVFAVRSAARGRSSFFVIAACSAAAMLVTQLALNVFGSTDILPFTGVTFPFVSKGGSSLISCWGMLAFFKAADTRQNASFSVRLSARRRFQEYEDEQPEGGDDL
ncbi:MAG: FtsW/RodA/SpoVE family cell cycle protein [Oscillospiraceae bacterium]|nr:FtsW/RodA/SpoVE family cell cycle protein [Oscillospiraceae bacterium]MBR6096132.1 FtsW/RodA/SpoVE family cell cycle protein [Oscillospiraceae bacterium]